MEEGKKKKKGKGKSGTTRTKGFKNRQSIGMRPRSGEESLPEKKKSNKDGTFCP